MPDELSIPRMPGKQIELWDITPTSGHIKSKQQTFTLSPTPLPLGHEATL